MSQMQPVRPSSHGRRLISAQARPTKLPALHRRGHSYNHTVAQGHGHASSSRSGSGGSKKAGAEVEVEGEEEEDDMASFPQFCATCEKQIMTPGNSILYCSEACRKRDGSLPTPIQILQSPSFTSPVTSYFDFQPADIMPQRSPTVLRPRSLGLSDLLTPNSSSSDDDTQESDVRRDSEVSQYLAQFYSDSTAEESASGQRIRLNRASTAAESGLPSLIHSPSSSVGTVASIASYSRPPARYNTVAGDFPNKSAELVVPSYPSNVSSSPTELMKDASLESCASTLTALHLAETSDV